MDVDRATHFRRTRKTCGTDEARIEYRHPHRVISLDAVVVESECEGRAWLKGSRHGTING